MTKILGDLIRQTTESEGVGDISLIDPEQGYFGFADYATDGDEVFYVIDDGLGNKEGGWGVFNAGATNSISRASGADLYFSTNGGAAVNFNSGIKTVIGAVSAKDIMFLVAAFSDGDIPIFSAADGGFSPTSIAALLKKLLTTSGDWAYNDGGTVVRKTTAQAAAILAPAFGNASIASTVAIGALKRKTIFRASGTWTRGTGTTMALVEVQGAGAGGGGIVSPASGSGASAAGGGAGDYERTLLDVTATSSASVTIGAGGAGGNGANGSNGGSSSFGSITAGGGVGGASPTAAATSYVAATGGAGGTGSGGDLSIPGNPGGNGLGLPGISAFCGTSGPGGDSIFGGGGAGTVQNNANGGNGTAPGSGGGGAKTNSATNRIGGAGADGIIIVWEY